MKAYDKAYYEAHREEMKAYRETRKEEMKAYNKAYNEAHKEEKNAKARAYYEAHKEETRARSKAYDEAHPEWRKAYNKAYRETPREEISARKRKKQTREKDLVDSTDQSLPPIQKNIEDSHPDTGKFNHAAVIASPAEDGNNNFYRDSSISQQFLFGGGKQTIESAPISFDAQPKSSSEKEGEENFIHFVTCMSSL